MIVPQHMHINGQSNNIGALFLKIGSCEDQFKTHSFFEILCGGPIFSSGLGPMGQTNDKSSPKKHLTGVRGPKTHILKDLFHGMKIFV